MQITHIESKCPCCDYAVNSHAPIDGEERVSPERGDISICVNCYAILEYDDKLKLNEAGIEKFIELPVDQRAEISNAIAVLKHLRSNCQ